jgi:excisionase family DNA binding protein
MKNEIYTVLELAEKLGVSDRTIADALRSGEMKGYKQFKKWYVTHEQLLEFLATNQEENKENAKRPNVKIDK